jgi:hypothetical protein
MLLRNSAGFNGSGTDKELGSGRGQLDAISTLELGQRHIVDQ